MNIPSDFEARQRALDLQTSFIVQAPAGSGKTGLLTQRFLGLLTTADDPEEVLAITFTRKAAAEMKQRLLEALEKAHFPEPEPSYEKVTWQLANKVLQRDQQLTWSILQNPSRLKIKTIDGLCASLVQQLPVLSGLGGNLGTTDSANQYYLQAAENIALLIHDEDFGPKLMPLVAHLDGNLRKLRELLADMLSKRLNWGAVVNDVASQEHSEQLLEQAWTDWVFCRINRLAEQMEPLRNQLQPLWQYACNQLALEEANNVPQHNAVSWSELSKQGWPEPFMESLSSWSSMANWLLTVTGEWRKTVNKNQGFLPQSAANSSDEKQLFKEKSQQMKQFLLNLREQTNQETESLRILLQEVAKLPNPEFSQEHTELLDSLMLALQLSLAELWILFKQQGELDFQEVSLRAQLSLGEIDQPTDLTLRLDYQIKHILVDEFQDTSQDQRQLLKLLTAGWQFDDGRTLFLVGDPMQSIYRFRSAEVSIFLETWQQQQLGQIALEPLSLTANFRSQKNLVEWVNGAFQKIFPKQNDEQLSAVCYARSEAMRDPIDINAVSVFPQAGRDDEQEALWILGQIQHVLQNKPDDSMAILVRNKSHLSMIAPLLRQHKIAFEAVDVEPLDLKPVVQDLFSLTAALSDPADRIHWLALLRAPWCGLTLKDITMLTSHTERLIPDLLIDKKLHKQLSDDGQIRLLKMAEFAEQWLNERGQKPVPEWVESAWMNLSGPATTNPQGLEDAQAFLALLRQFIQKTQTTGISLDLFRESLSRLFAQPEKGGKNPIYLMTMHKSKGLEFDHVFLPGLGRSARAEDQPLLGWLQWPKSDGEYDLLMAPIKGPGEKQNAFYNVIYEIRKAQSVFEVQRLLYVATTRAVKQLYLSGHIKNTDTDKPPANSLLSILWPVISEKFNKLSDEDRATQMANELENLVIERRLLTRLDSNWQPPAVEENFIDDQNLKQKDNLIREDVEFSWAGERSRVVGVIAHRLFQWIADFSKFNGYEKNSHLPNDELQFIPWFNKLTPLLTQQIMQEGLTGEQATLAMKNLQMILRNSMTSKIGRWILDPGHKDPKNEWALTLKERGEINHLVIDRSFIEQNAINQSSADQGFADKSSLGQTDVRWIIDYKTGSHQGGDLEGFLESELQRYKPQLERYGRAVSNMENNPIKLGLYFPAINEWITWDLPAC